MGISVKTRKMLWGRSANRCNFPDCRRELVMDATETDDESIIGEECHKVAREQEGPRGKSTLSPEQRDKYNNLILMCNVHHKIIDDQPGTYTVEILTEMKKSHEGWVRTSLNYDRVKQRDDEIYSTYIEEWCNYVDINNWDAWTSWMLGSGQPKISKEMDTKMGELKVWMLSRVWPKRYAELEASFDNFRRVLEDLFLLFHEHATEKGSMHITEKFYRIDYWDDKVYSELLKEFNFHVDLIQDLVLEITRAANYICDNVRKYIIRNFRISEGILLVTYGPCRDFSFNTIRVEYIGSERILKPYSNLEIFKEVRVDRDFAFGVGKSVKDAEIQRLELVDKSRL